MIRFDRLSKMRRALCAGLIAVAALTGLAACGDGKKAVTPSGLALEVAPVGQLPAGVTPLAYRLELVTDPAADVFSGRVEIDVRLDEPHQRIWLHALEQTITKVEAKVPGRALATGRFTGNQAEGGVARLDFDAALPAGETTLIIDYTAPYNTSLAGLYKVVVDDEAYLATQMEPIDARRLVPSFDEPRFKTPWTISVSAPAGLQVISNAKVLSTTKANDGMTRHAFAPTRAIPSYLIALAVGPYEARGFVRKVDATGDSARIPLQGFTARGKSGQLSPVFDVTHDMLRWQETYFATPYPYGKLDLIAAPDFAYGAMENAGAIVYRESALLMDETTTPAQRRRILGTHAHELGHQWFGNYVTPKWWNDIWLNEAFATWFSAKTLAATDPEGDWSLQPVRGGLNAMSNDSLASARQIRNPIATNGDIFDGFDAITYQKGASVLNMFEAWLGEAAFREGLRQHMRRFPDGVADADDFMQSLADGAASPAIAPAFRSFILQPGIPLLDITIDCPNESFGELRIKQRRYAPHGSAIDANAQTWQIPFSARVFLADGTSRVERALLTKRDQTLRLDACPVAVMPNADGTGYWRYALAPDATQALTAQYEKLGAAEQLVFADALLSGFRAGRLTADDLRGGLERIAKGEDEGLSFSLAALPVLSSLIADESRAPFANWVETVYAPRLAGIDKIAIEKQSESQRLLRPLLADALARHGTDKSRRAKLRVQAEEAMGLKVAAPNAKPPIGELASAMMIGVQVGGAEFHDAGLADVQASQDQSRRATVLSALAQYGAPERVLKLLEDVQADTFSDNERYLVLTSAMNNAEARGRVWAAVRRDFERIVAGVPQIRKAQLGGLAGTFCSKADASAAQSFFEANAASLPGYERALAQGVERAALCSASKALKADEVSAAFVRTPRK